jgi:hypothetical protein
MYWVWATLPEGQKVLINLGPSPTILAKPDGSGSHVLTGGVTFDPRAKDGAGAIHYGFTPVRETPEELLALPMVHVGKPANGKADADVEIMMGPHRAKPYKLAAFNPDGARPVKTRAKR